MSGDDIQVASDDGITVGLDDGIVIAGAADSCACGCNDEEGDPCDICDLGTIDSLIVQFAGVEICTECFDYGNLTYVKYSGSLDGGYLLERFIDPGFPDAPYCSFNYQGNEVTGIQYPYDVFSEDQCVGTPIATGGLNISAAVSYYADIDLWVAEVIANGGPSGLATQDLFHGTAEGSCPYNTPIIDNDHTFGCNEDGTPFVNAGHFGTATVTVNIV